MIEDECGEWSVTYGSQTQEKLDSTHLLLRSPFEVVDGSVKSNPVADVRSGNLPRVAVL